MLVCSLLGTFLLLSAAGATRAEDKWGTIKGQVIYGGEKAPAPVVLKVDKDAPDCLATKKQLVSEEWVVDPKTKGIKWVYVYLIPDSRDPKDITKPIPTHPALKGKKLPNVEVDQPCCVFEPYAIALQEGQSITAKNSMKIAHNVKVDGNPAVGNPTINQLVPGGGNINIGPFKAQATPVPLACNVHSWMSGYVRVFSHPYFFVTKEDGQFEIKDAPAGKYRLVIWHPGSGWVVGDKEPDKFGISIEIKADKTTDLGQYKVQPPTK
jgi:hypothetical protein